MSQRPDHLHRLAALCHEAVRLHEGDWPKIQLHIRAALAGLSPADSAGLERALQMVRTADEGSRSTGRLN